MKREIVKKIVTVNLIPFMEIKPSDVLFSKSLIHKFYTDKPKIGNEYFLWAQSDGAMTDIWVQGEVLNSEKYGNIGDLISESSLPPKLKVNANLPAKEAQYPFGAWEGKRVNIPLSLNDELNEETFLGSKASHEMLSNLNDNLNYFNKQCLVLRANDELDVHSMALAYFMSEAVKATSQTFKSIDEIVNFILCLEIDMDALKQFHESRAEKYTKDIKYAYRNILIKDFTSCWESTLEIISSLDITFDDLENSFRNMGMVRWSTADDFRNLNNKLGALFLSPYEYEIFLRSGSLGSGVPFRSNDPNFSKAWLKKKIAERGQDAIIAFYEVHGRFNTELIHFFSSPIQRVFANKLLKVLPSKDVIWKHAEVNLKQAFYDDHKAIIECGKKVRNGTTEGGKRSKEQTEKEFNPKYRKAEKLIKKTHKENPKDSWTKVTNSVAEQTELGASTLRKKFNKEYFGNW
jgi:hypothetical protein